MPKWLVSLFKLIGVVVKAKQEGKWSETNKPSFGDKKPL